MNGIMPPDSSPSVATSSTAAGAVRRALLIVLEVVVFVLWLVPQVVDLSFLDLYAYWLGMMFFWLVVLLFVASLKMFSKHRLPAIVGLGLVALIVETFVILPTLSPGHR